MHARRKIMWAALSVIVLCVTLLGYLLLSSGNKTPLDAYAKQVSFPLYFPHDLKNGYTVQPGSITMTNEIILFTLSGEGETIYVTQQAAPTQLENYKLDAFTSIATASGTMLVGTVQDKPVAIINTPKTLVTITASASQAQESVSTIGQSLRKIEQ